MGGIPQKWIQVFVNGSRGENEEISIFSSTDPMKNPKQTLKKKLSPDVSEIRYRRLFDLIEGPKGVKQVYLLTATPINNRLIDLQHMIELFSRRNQDHFKNTLGINSLQGHFRRMEKDLENAASAATAPATGGEARPASKAA